MPFPKLDLELGLGDLVVPEPEEPVSSWEELNRLLQEHQALAPQGTQVGEPRPFNPLVENAPGSRDVPASPWFDNLMRQTPQNTPDGRIPFRQDDRSYAPNMQPYAIPGGEIPWQPGVPPDAPPETADPQGRVPIALRRFLTQGGVPFTMEEIPGSYMGPFLNDLESTTGVKINEVQGNADRNQRGLPGSNPNKPSAHSPRDGSRAVDVNPNYNAPGTRGQFDPNVLAGVLARHPAIEPIRGDPMHFQVRRSYLGGPAPQQSGGNTQVATLGELVDPQGNPLDEETLAAMSPEVRQASRQAQVAPQAQAPTGQAAGAPTSSWAELASNAPARAAALAFAAQAFMPTWGGFGETLGRSIGAAAGAYGETSAGLLKQMEGEKDDERKTTDSAADRASREKVATLGADSRAEVAHIRGQYSNQRAALALQKAQPAVAIKYLTEARKIVKQGMEQIGNISTTLDDATITQMVRDKAAELYQADADRGLVPQPTGQSAPGQSSAIAGPASGGAATATPGKSGAVAPAETGKKMSWENYKKEPGVQEMMADPGFREKLFAKRPDFRHLWEMEVLSSTLPPAGGF